MIDSQRVSGAAGESFVAHVTQAKKACIVSAGYNSMNLNLWYTVWIFEIAAT